MSIEHESYQRLVSVREVQRRYTNIPSGTLQKDRVNTYVCECGYITATIDKDYGVTPMFHDCEACGEFANSNFYSEESQNFVPTQEWYKPSIEEVMKLRKKPAVLEHVFSGGLLNRRL